VYTSTKRAEHAVMARNAGVYLDEEDGAIGLKKLKQFVDPSFSVSNMSGLIIEGWDAPQSQPHHTRYVVLEQVFTVCLYER
jgi:hypothetical protein